MAAPLEISFLGNLMIKDALFLARKDLGHLIREWTTWLWAIVMPIGFFYFIGTITGGMAGPIPAEAIGVVVGKDAGFLANEFMRGLQAVGYKVDRVDAAALPFYGRRITIPADFTSGVLAGKQGTISFSRTGTGLNADYDEIRLKRAAYGVLADLITANKRTGKATPEAFREVQAMPRTLTLEVTPAGTRQTVPVGFQQAVPGTMVQFILLMMFTTGGVTLYFERTRGILRRLASTPMSRSAVVLGKALSRLTIGFFQIAFAMIAGSFLFKVDWGPHVIMVVCILCSYAVFAAFAGMILGNFAKSDGQLIAIGVIFSNILSAVGGCWWPIEITPSWAQKASLVLPTGWAMGAMHHLVSFGNSPLSVLPHLLALAAAALCAGYFISRYFRFQ
jgi:ABC-2 type transport system permease protein